MKPESIKYILLIILVFVSTSFPQSNRYTKGAENGYMWQAMSEPNLMYSVSKENYLSSILDRTQITGEKYPEIASLTCREDIEKIYKEGKSNKLSLEDVVKRIDAFYSQKENLVIPIIFAYCYTIKQFAKASSKELKRYKEEVLKFCNK
jgi:hypothetical protein